MALSREYLQIYFVGVLGDGFAQVVQIVVQHYIGKVDGVGCILVHAVVVGCGYQIVFGVGPGVHKLFGRVAVAWPGAVGVVECDGVLRRIAGQYYHRVVGYLPDEEVFGQFVARVAQQFASVDGGNHVAPGVEGGDDVRQAALVAASHRQAVSLEMPPDVVQRGAVGFLPLVAHGVGQQLFFVEGNWVAVEDIGFALEAAIVLVATRSGQSRHGQEVDFVGFEALGLVNGLCYFHDLAQPGILGQSLEHTFILGCRSSPVQIGRQQFG